MKDPSAHQAPSPRAGSAAVFASQGRPSAVTETVAGPGAAIVALKADATRARMGSPVVGSIFVGRDKGSVIHHNESHIVEPTAECSIIATTQPHKIGREHISQ